MNRKNKPGSGLHAYLESMQVLDKSEVEIKAARKSYWAEYKRNWKKANLKNTFEIAFTDSELKIITEAAQMYDISRTSLIKQSALAHLQKVLLPKFDLFLEIRNLLLLQSSVILNSVESGNINESIGNALLEKIEIFEHDIQLFLQRPKTER